MRQLSKLLTIAIALVSGSAAEADFLLAFHGPGCWACDLMLPREAQLRREGIRIREVDATTWPAGKLFYRIRRWPTYVIVRERDGREYDSGQRLQGPVETGKLREFADGLHSVLKQPAK